MKTILATALAFALAATLAACGQRPDEQTPEAPDAAPASSAIASSPGPAGNGAGKNMASAEGGKTAEGRGTVVAVDPTAGTITIDHGPIPEANWPAMTMGFKASPTVAEAVVIGDKVEFELKLENGGGQVMSIRKQ